MVAGHTRYSTGAVRRGHARPFGNRTPSRSRRQDTGANLITLDPSEIERRLDLAGKIRDVPNFPREGILFKDITTLLQEPQAFRAAVDLLTADFRDERVDLVVGVESRGFIFGGALAYQLGAGFVPVRKEGKLPHLKIQEAYQLEYGAAVLEIHRDAIRPGQRVVIVDDLLATGGTARATAKLVSNLGGVVVGISFLIELGGLKGAEALAGYRVLSHIKF